ncbi:uncharacterized protein LOC125078925 [Lutra lutra]|uniref:uncharacterized protein LOC125078925 n=1 Tax=Lutra lutra TaxID=9657 RepID=UPI001FD4393F|nr:uncharacterized protein LOC125078925 [Lutra lutra]XP_047548151.1 uncharacterized protein LOC125078925 [Lutra lutra]
MWGDWGSRNNPATRPRRPRPYLNRASHPKSSRSSLAGPRPPAGFQGGPGCSVPPGLSHLSLRPECGWLEEEARLEGWGGEGTSAGSLPAGSRGRLEVDRKGSQREKVGEKGSQGGWQPGGEHARGKMAVPLACGGSWPVVPPEACHGLPGQALLCVEFVESADLPSPEARRGGDRKELAAHIGITFLGHHSHQICQLCARGRACRIARARLSVFPGRWLGTHPCLLSLSGSLPIASPWLPPKPWTAVCLSLGIRTRRKAEGAVRPHEPQGRLPGTPACRPAFPLLSSSQEPHTQGRKAGPLG